MKRKAELVLGLTGGILGLFFALSLYSNNIDVSRSWVFYFLVLVEFGFSILGIIGSSVVKSKPVLGGVLLLLCAIGCGLIPFRLVMEVSSTIISFIPGILLLIAGIMGVVRKDRPKNAGA
jgi:hypothetical protein